VRTGASYMLASAFAFSVMTVIVKGVGAHLPSHEIVFARALVSVVLSYVLIRRAGIEPLGTRRRLLLVRGMLGCAGLWCVFYSVTHLPLAEATVIQYLHPTFTAVLAAFFLREIIPLRVLLAGAVSLAGVALVAAPDDWMHALEGSELLLAPGLPPLALAAAVGGAFFSGAAYVVVRRLSRDEDPLVIVLYFPLVTLPVTLPFVVYDFVIPSLWECIALLGVGLTTQAGQVWLTRGLALLPASRATAFSYAQVIFAALWGVLFFGEIPSLMTGLGACLIIGGTLSVAMRPIESGTPTETPRDATKTTGS
jgi:drug/metabolite transporter (DMT)-like permease